MPSKKTIFYALHPAIGVVLTVLAGSAFGYVFMNILWRFIAVVQYCGGIPGVLIFLFLMCVVLVVSVAFLAGLWKVILAVIELCLIKYRSK